MSYRNSSLLREDELRTIEKSERDFREELTYLRKTSEVFLRTFDVLSNENVHEFSHSKDSTYRISYRVFRILRCAFDSSLKGYCDVSMALLRISYENHLLMNYLSKHEEEAKLWFDGKSFSPSFLRKNVSYASDSLYKDMCEFVHSSFKSTFAFTEVEKDRTKATLGEYNKERFKTVLFLMLITMATTIIWLSVTFAEELMKNEEWHRTFKNTVPKMWKYLKERIKEEKG